MLFRIIISERAIFDVHKKLVVIMTTIIVKYQTVKILIGEKIRLTVSLGMCNTKVKKTNFSTKVILIKN